MSDEHDEADEFEDELDDEADDDDRHDLADEADVADVDDDEAIASELDVDPAVQARLADIAASPLSEHAEAYQQFHSELQQALADIDAS